MTAKKKESGLPGSPSPPEELQAERALGAQSQRSSRPGDAPAGAPAKAPFGEEERERLLREITALRESLLARDRTPKWKQQENAAGRAGDPAGRGRKGPAPSEDASRPAWKGAPSPPASSDKQYFHLRPNAVSPTPAGRRQPRPQALREESAPPPHSNFRQTHGGRMSLWRLLWDRGFLRVRRGAEPPPVNGPFGTPGKRKWIFVGHEASRTGAPLVLLYLIRDMAKSPDVECFVFLDRDGPLLDDFNEVAHVIVNDRNLLFSHSDLDIPALLSSLAAPAPDLAICNSAEVWRFMPEMRHEAPMTRLSLIDERLSHYQPEVHSTILENSDAIVFPSEAVRQVAIGIDPRFEPSLVIPHGLMRPEFGKTDRAAARLALRRELGIAEDALIVLGCGTLDRRKGSDLVALVADRVRQSCSVDVHFLWLGGVLGGPAAYDQRKWILHDLNLLGLQSMVHFLDSRPDPEPCFVGADLFLLTSRDDPFPCVIHEAMAASLPVICFDKAGGTPEALVGGCGKVVPYLNIEAMAASVVELLNDPDLRADMGRRAETRVRTVYRSEDFSSRILELADRKAGKL